MRLGHRCNLTLVLHSLLEWHIDGLFQVSYSKLHLVPHVHETRIRHLLFVPIHCCKVLYTDSVRLRKLNLSDEIAIHLAKICIIELSHVSDLLRSLSARNAVLVLASDLAIPESHAPCIENNHALGENILLGKAEDYLDDFHRLYLADKPWHHAQDAPI